MVCSDLPHLTHGPLSCDLRLWATQFGHRADPVWTAIALAVSVGFTLFVGFFPGWLIDAAKAATAARPARP